MRASFSDEAAALKLRNTALVDRNSEATRQLDALRDTIASLRGTTSSSASSPANIPNSPSTSSFSAVPVYSARTPTTPLRSIPSSTQVNDPQDVSIVQRLPGTEQIGGKKFKWGKGKPEPPRSVLPATASTGPKPSSTTGRAAELGRIHTFQQTSILRPVRCEYCGDKMWGLNEVRCGGESVCPSPHQVANFAVDSLWMLLTQQVRWIPQVILCEPGCGGLACKSLGWTRDVRE